MEKEHKEENSYRRIIRRGVAFGGLQVLQIIIALLKGKVMAMFLGAEGMGISSLFSSSSSSIQKASSMGLNLALVKETAASYADREKLADLVSASRRLILLTSLVGTLICVAFSRHLSIITFGDESMRWQFMLLGAAVGLSYISRADIPLARSWKSETGGLGFHCRRSGRSHLRNTFIHMVWHPWHCSGNGSVVTDHVCGLISGSQTLRNPDDLAMVMEP